MPDEVDKTIDVFVPLPPNPGGTTPAEGDDEMSLTVSGGTIEAVVLDVPSGIQQQALARLSSAGTAAHEHFVTFGKVLDFLYVTEKNMVSLVQSLGVREVTSAAGHAGIPNAGKP